MGSSVDKGVPTMNLWNLSDVHVGYDVDIARQFQLEGKDEKDICDALPKLRVDSELPY